MNRVGWVYLWLRSTRPWVATIEGASTPWRGPHWDLSDSLCLVFDDGYPVTEGHLLFVPRLDHPIAIAYAAEKAARHGLVMRRDGDWDGFNVGMNCGSAAGQTVWWPHIHLIPRREGDVADPVGGVRNVIPGQGNYRSPKYLHP